MNRFSFNSDWLFHEFDLDTTLDEMLSFDSFESICVPHDYMIYHVNDLYKDSIGFYKKNFSVSIEKDHSYIIRFEGVYMDTKIFLNGTQIFEWKYGYSTFDVDLTPFLSNGENVIAVLVTYQSPNTRWYSGAGIYRNVWFIDKEPSYIVPDGVYFSAKKADDGFKVNIDTSLLSKTGFNGLIRHSLINAANEVVYISEKKASFSNNYRDTQSFEIKAPCLWDIDNPYLYTLKTELLSENGLSDASVIRVGFKDFFFDADNGFFLNGRNVKINGVCMHHDLGALGAAMNKVALKRQLEMLLEMGVNAIRTSHNMPSVELMDLADEMGILIYSESFDMWELSKTTYDYARFFPDWHKKDVASWIQRDRNHASLFIWGIGNEIYDTHAGDGYKWTIILRDLVKEYDYYHNAYIGIGSNFIEWDNAQKCSNELELSGYNYAEKLYDSHHKKYPHWCIFGSETASTVQSRGIYHFPFETRLLTHDDSQCSSLGNCSTNWGAPTAAHAIIAHRDRAFVFGQFLWTGFDYIGEPTPYHTKNSFFGQIDTAGFKKDTFFQYKAEWTDASKSPFVHLLPYWDYNEGQIIDICAYTNAPFIELFLNGDSLGRQFIDHANGTCLQGHWKVPFTKGEITAIAYDLDENIVAKESKHSFEDPKKIVLSADKAELLSDGNDLAFIEISALDINDNTVENARNRIFVSVSGPGRLVGLDNGDSTDYEEYKCNSRRLFSGKLLAIIASTGDAGSITVTASSDGLESASVTLSALACDTPVTSAYYSKQVASSLMSDIPVRKIELTLEGNSVLTKETPSSKVFFKTYPENATYKDVYFKALTKDAVEANYAKVELIDNYALVTALGDGEFTLNAYTNNDKDHPEVISSLEFKSTGLGLASFNPYEIVPGISFNEANSEDAKLSFLGGVFLPPSDDGFSFATFTNLDFGKYGSDTIHVPIFSFRDEHEIEIFEGDASSKVSLFKGTYFAKSIYNQYQENVFTLSKKLTGLTAITIKVKSEDRISLKGFYFDKPKKAYSRLKAMDKSIITGDSFKLENEAITSIGNNVSIDFAEMHFSDGISGIKIVGKSNVKMTSIHLLFNDNEHNINQLVEFPFSEEYKELFFPLESVSTNGRFSFVFLPGSNFDLLEFEFVAK